MKSSAAAILGVVACLVGVAFLVPAPVAAATPAYHFDLFGSSSNGWGNTSASESGAGMLFVTPGASVTITAYSTESGITHDWYLDLNNNGKLDYASDPHTANFTTSASVTFTAPPSGTFSYYCQFHPTVMKGTLVVSAPTFVLYGSAAAGSNGWGFTSTSITYPGPTLDVNQGATVSVDLFSADGQAHTFYVDFANSGSASGNTVSAQFNGTAVIRFTFVATNAGNFTYACSLHTASVMKGTLHVAGSGGSSTTPSGPNYTVYAAAIVIIAVVAVVAAVLLRRKPKAPPMQPPQ